MKIAATAFVLSLSMLPVAIMAQQVQKCCGTSNSTFLLGNTTFAPHTQCLYLPGDLLNAQNGTITQLYYRYGSTGQDLGNTLGGLLIRLGQTAATTFTGGNTFFTELDTVLLEPSFTIPPGSSGDWFSIPLQIPFPYLSSRTLIVDIWFETSITANFGTYGTTNTGRKLYALDLLAATGSTSSSAWQDMGFDLEMPTGISPHGDPGPIVLPQDGSLLVTLPHAASSNSWIRLFDPSGRMVQQALIPQGSTRHAIALEGMAPGVYLAQVLLDVGTARSVRFVIP